MALRPLLPCQHLSQLLHPCGKERSNGKYNICIWHVIHQNGRCQFLPSFPMTAAFILRVISFQISLSWVVYWKQASAFVACSCSTLYLGDFVQIHERDSSPGSIFFKLHVYMYLYLKCFYLISRESSPTRFDLRWDRPSHASGMVLDHSLIPHFVGIQLHIHTQTQTGSCIHTYVNAHSSYPARVNILWRIKCLSKKDIRWY